MSETTWRDVPMPARIASLRRDEIGRPVPWFVAWIDGQPDFRIIGAGRLEDAHRFNKCWICGQNRGRFGTFVIGPMCAVNRVSAEPPSHRECAEYSARACPFLTTPRMIRRERHMPDGVVDPAGMVIRRNPGVTLVWTTKHWSQFSTGDGYLYTLGIPSVHSWWCEGRPATRQEAMASIDSGMPILTEAATEDGPHAVEHLAAQLATALMLLPEAA